jgi:hypothetical protein
MHARRVRFVDTDNRCQFLRSLPRAPFDLGASVVRRILPWALCLLLAGQGCQGTRLPNLAPTAYDADKRSFNVHDPLPETNIGPDTGARPPGFLQERSEPRRTQESEALLGIPPGGTNNGPPPGTPTGPPPGVPVGP